MLYADNTAAGSPTPVVRLFVDARWPARQPSGPPLSTTRGGGPFVLGPQPDGPSAGGVTRRSDTTLVGRAFSFLRPLLDERRGIIPGCAREPLVHHSYDLPYMCRLA
jgi:hypothetical protein